MHTKRALFCSLLAILLLASAGATEAKKKNKGGNPMNIEEGALDEIHLETATLAGDVPVVIRPFSTDDTDFGTGGEGGKEGRVQAAETMRKVGPELLAEAMKDAIEESRAFGPVTIAGAGDSVPDGALVVEGEILSMNPGSRAKRYLVGFGAGASGVGVGGAVKDASGKVLAEFKHRKHSAVGIGGGDYVKFMSDDARDVGKDIGRFLATWARGGDLTED